jgi:CDP-diacylglycerol---glycerol-3-phosphate 3-phosphatidyltransferase
MQANLVTLVRSLMVFMVIGLYGVNTIACGIALILTVVVLYMDALDGIIARRLGISSDMGALFDITGDRIVENVFWVYFASIGAVSFWAATIVVARSFFVDWLRTMAFADQGKTPFGDKTMMHTGWAKALVSSRFSRALYGVTKALVFVYLGGLLMIKAGTVDYGWSISHATMAFLILGGQVIVWTTVMMCVLRGIPVIWDSYDILSTKMFPGLLK